MENKHTKWFFIDVYGKSDRVMRASTCTNQKRVECWGGSTTTSNQKKSFIFITFVYVSSSSLSTQRMSKISFFCLFSEANLSVCLHVGRVKKQNPIFSASKLSPSFLIYSHWFSVFAYLGPIPTRTNSRRERERKSEESKESTTLEIQVDLNRLLSYRFRKPNIYSGLCCLLCVCVFVFLWVHCDRILSSVSLRLSLTCE